MLRTGFTVIFCTVLAITAAFSAGKNQVDTTGSSNVQTITVTDLAGREVTIKMPIKKVSINWAGSGGAFMSMSALLGKDVADYLSSWDGDLQRNRFDMWEHYRSVVPALEQIPDVGGVDRNDFNLEMLINLKPDLVIWTLSVKQQAEEVVEPALQKAGIPIVYIDHHAETIENHSRTTRLLGKLFGKEARAEGMIDFYVKNRTMIEERLAGVTKKPVVYIEIGMGGPTKYSNTFSNTYMWGAMVVRAGGTNLADGIVTRYSPIEPELLISRNPDYIVFTGSYWPSIPDSLRMGYLSDEESTQKQLQNFCKRPGWDSLQAVKGKQVYAIHHGIGREMYDPAAIAFLAKSFYPDLFADIDPLGMLKEYYNRFLPYTISGVWMTQLK
jgi:iron complex transport system substrate-binding protein